MQFVEEFIESMFEKSQIRFVWQGTTVLSQEIAASDFYLPILVDKANQIGECIGLVPFPEVVFSRDDKAVLGMKLADKHCLRSPQLSLALLLLLEAAHQEFGVELLSRIDRLQIVELDEIIANKCPTFVPKGIRMDELGAGN